MINIARCSASTPLASDAADDAPAVWVQVTQEIDAKGYGGGRFKFDRNIFEQVIRNFRTNPSYVAGPDGIGVADVVPWDFNHASEMDPSSGSVPSQGTPAQGWIRELQMRQGPQGLQLWGLTRWLEPARSYIKNGQYKWASVVVLFDARDPVTNANVGAVLTSVALTNQPFVEGMQPLIAASRQPSSRVAATRAVRLGVDVSRHSPAARQLVATLGRRVVATPNEDTPLAPQLDATKAPGANPTQRALAALRQHSQGFARLPYDEQFTRAVDALKLGAVRA